MAAACVEQGVRFGYLHVVSDNLACEDSDGLVDERKDSVRAKCRKLLQEAESFLERYFDEIEQHADQAV
jgi:hypothetical protein